MFEADEAPPIVSLFVYVEGAGLRSAGRTKRESSDDEVTEIEPIATLATHSRVQRAHSHSLCTSEPTQSRIVESRTPIPFSPRLLDARSRRA